MAACIINGRLIDGTVTNPVYGVTVTVIDISGDGDPRLLTDPSNVALVLKAGETVKDISW